MFLHFNEFCSGKRGDESGRDDIIKFQNDAHCVMTLDRYGFEGMPIFMS
jgi:hypothetical protein